MRASGTPAIRLDRLTSRQHGVVSRVQALEAGLTRDQLEHGVGTGRWVRVARGVYRMAGAPFSWQQATMTACLTSKGVASHLTAAALLGFAEPPLIPHVTVPRGSSARMGGVVVHWGTLGPSDRCWVGPMPCTRPGRTLIDCAYLVTFEALCELVDAAFCAGLADPGGVRRAAVRASRAPGRRGLAAIRSALEVWTPGAPPGSPAEMRLVRRLVAYGLPEPVRQFVVRDPAGRFVARVDLAWPDRRLALEYDGRRWHGPRRWTADGERGDRLRECGWRVERVRIEMLSNAGRSLPADLVTLLRSLPAA